MKKSIIDFLSIAVLMTAIAVSITACSTDDNLAIDDDNGNNSEESSYFHLIIGVGDDGNDGTFTQAANDISAANNSITFAKYGFEVPSTRTARIIGSETGKYLYSLDYGGGTITKYLAEGGQKYSKYPSANQSTITVTSAIGTTNPRWGKVSEEMALLHNITTERVYSDDAGLNYDYTEAVASLVGVKLGGDSELSIESVQNLEIPRSEEDIEKGLNIWRIDAPVVHNGKVYYGVAKRGYDSQTGENISTKDYATTTLVADYPSLTNLRTITSTQYKGENYGYRTPVNHLDEKGDIYQLVGNGVHAKMLKISNDDYDNSYAFDLSAALGQEVGALGWFYTGNGIGYVMYYDLQEGQDEVKSAWGVARINVHTQTAFKMNIPYKLWLRQYQSGVVRDGKFHMALSPVGEDGAVFVFDPASESPDGYTIGATLDNQAGQFFIGIF
ncbi:MAG: hypothetical protein GX762_09750 [Bacteroidales bacterium]|jgi:hypothetical protein|nr:hypothetical protein [Bacteroidales bacterium]